MNIDRYLVIAIAAVVAITSVSVAYAASFQATTANSGNDATATYGLLDFTDGNNSFSSSQNVKSTFTVNNADFTITNGYQIRYTDTDATTDKVLLTAAFSGLSALAGANLHITIGTDTYDVPISSQEPFTFADMCLDLTSGTCTLTLSIVIQPYSGLAPTSVSNCRIMFTAYHLDGGWAE